MARNFMRVVVVNESDATLRLRHHWTSGDWTPGGWQPSQFPATAPGAGLHWQAEGESVSGVVPLTGVEARAWYDVVDQTGTVIGDFYIFANSPLIESQYGNTFHVRAPKGYYAAYVDAHGQKKGNRAILEISFRKTHRVAVPGFRPSVNGFQFSNRWNGDLPVVSLGSLWNSFRDAMADVADALGIGSMPDDLVPITHADTGLCGGMVYTVMDYFNARQLPPPAATDASGLSIAPQSPNDPLFRHIRQRLLDSFDLTGRGHRWLSYSSPLYPDDDEGVLQSLGAMKGKSWITYREEWPRIRELLDLGQLVPIGLVQTSELDIGANHQVLAYAYQQDGQVVRLWIYDPNVPRQQPAPALADDLYLEFDITNTADGITVTRHNCRADDYKKRIYAILHMDNYVPRTPPSGQAFPSPDLPKIVNLVTSAAESTTTDGTVTSERTNHCGDVLQFGTWTTKTTATVVVQLSGFLNPTVAWKIDGKPLVAGTTSVGIVRDVHSFDVGCQVDAGGRSLTLSSQPGDTYHLQVAVDVTDVLGNTGHAETVFQVEGSYSGMRLEDIRAEARCIASTIPAPIDLDVFTVPKPRPEEDPGWDAQEWRHGVLDRLRVDQSLDSNSHEAIRSYVELQVNTPEFRSRALDLARNRRSRPVT
ncbi:hypothetical protein [Micromonospora sp. NPDC023737]|uniref:hypothetical protein n=1 Tax=unclassified Micromonospora TaxID=2617518 RepID=UPI0033C2652A